jgi:hypothetical protein
VAPKENNNLQAAIDDRTQGGLLLASEGELVVNNLMLIFVSRAYVELLRNAMGLKRAAEDDMSWCHRIQKRRAIAV